MKLSILTISGIIVLVGLAGFFVASKKATPTGPIACTEEARLCPDGSYVGRTGPNCEFAECPPIPLPAPAAFGNPTTLAIKQELKFNDGLTVTLTEINDSRCQPGVVCVWEGELSVRLTITGGDTGKSPKEIRLGTVLAKSVTESGYTFILQKATPTTAIIIVINVVEEISLREGERESSLLVQKIYPDHITGLNFPEYPVGGGPGYPITLRIEEVASNGCTIRLPLLVSKGILLSL